MNILTKEEMAHMLDGLNCVPESVPGVARRSGLVIIYGLKDNDSEMVIAGAIEERLHYWKDAYAWFEKGKMIVNHCDEECPNFDTYIEGKHYVGAIYCDTPGEPEWVYDTDIPCVRFRLMEGDATFCIGIVFHIKEIGGEA